MEEGRSGSREHGWPSRGERRWWLNKMLAGGVRSGMDFAGKVIGPAGQWDVGCD